MSNPAFDLASIAQQGEATDKLPPRTRRKSNNPFSDIVRKVAEEKVTWKLPAVSTEDENGEPSVARRVESLIRQAGNRLDATDKENGGVGWKTVIRRQPSPDGSEVTISFTMERRAGHGTEAPAESETSGEHEAPARRTRRTS